jgi:hypothetical protein
MCLLRSTPNDARPFSPLLPKQNRLPGSSHGVCSKIALPSTSRCVSRLPPKWGPRLPSLERGPSLSFFPTSTVYSTQRFAGLLHPAADHGVRTVLSLSPTTIARCPTRQTLSRTPSLRSFSLGFWPCTVTQAFLPSSPEHVPLSSFPPRPDESENPPHPLLRPQGVDHC